MGARRTRVERLGRRRRGRERRTLRPEPDEFRDLYTILAELAVHDPRDPLVLQYVRARARDAFEYCLVPTYGRFEVEHVIPPRRWAGYVARRIPGLAPVADGRGPDHVENYAWSCRLCNGRKPQHVTHRVGAKSYRLFDPRRDVWARHFSLWKGVSIVGGTACGKGLRHLYFFSTPNGRPPRPATVACP